MAVNCWTVPTALLELVGVTAIEDRVAAVTAKVFEPEMVPDVALMVVVPAASEEAFPAASMVATEVFEELQMTDEVMS